MYLQTSRLQYNLQKVGVSQKALSNKIFKPMLVKLLYHRSCYSSSDRCFITLRWVEKVIIVWYNIIQ